MSPVILFVVIGYAVLATALAAYGLLFGSGEKFDTGHPLSTIPDNFGEFDPATRKKVTQLKFPVDGELPAAQRARLGEKIRVGKLEIQPLDIVKRPLTIETEGKNGEFRKDGPGHALVLRLDIKNLSNDWIIHPMDPAFTRKSSPTDTPITRIVMNKQLICAGGAIPWPNVGLVKKRIESQQKNDSIPLAPGEAREYVVFTDAEKKIIDEVAGAKEPLQWRVQVRRDPVQFHGKDVPVTAIIGVDFNGSEVRELR